MNPAWPGAGLFGLGVGGSATDGQAQPQAGASADPLAAMFASFMADFMTSTGQPAAPAPQPPAAPRTPAAPAPQPPAAPVPAPSRAAAAAGSEEALQRSPEDRARFQELKKFALSTEVAEEEKELSKKCKKEEDDSRAAKLKFSKFMENYEGQKKKEASEETEEESEDEDDDFKPKNKRGRKKVSASSGGGRPKGKRMKTESKEHLRDVIESQKYEIKFLSKKVEELENKVAKLKLELKIKNQEEVNADVIEISSSDEDVLAGLPMSFEWSPGDRTLKKPAPEEDNNEWEASNLEDEDPSIYLVPDDDFGHLESYSIPEDLPYVEKGTINVESVKFACKSCTVNEARYRITNCNHFGVCEDCAASLKDALIRCPGCGVFHVMSIDDKKLYM